MRDIAFTYNFYQAHRKFPYLPTYTEQFVVLVALDEITVVITELPKTALPDL